MHFSLVSSTKSEACTLSGTFASLSAKARSAGASYDRVAPEDDERLDLTGRHGVGERLEIGHGVELVRIGHGRVDDGRAGRAQPGVHRVRERVQARRLARAHDDEGATVIGREVLRDGPEPLRGEPVGAAFETLRWISSLRFTPFFESSRARARPYRSMSVAGKRSRWSAVVPVTVRAGSTT